MQIYNYSKPSNKGDIAAGDAPVDLQDSATIADGHSDTDLVDEDGDPIGVEGVVGLQTKRGNIVRVFDDFNFRLVKNQNGTILWRCRQANNPRVKCPMYATTLSRAGRVIRFTRNQQHNHPPRSEAIAVQAARDAIFKEAKTTRERPGVVVNRMLPTLDLDTRREMAARMQMKSLMKAINKERQKDPDYALMLLQPADRHFEMNPMFDDIVILDNREDPATVENANNERVVILGHPEMLPLLKEARLLLGDGTFFFCPSPFKQLYSIHVQVGNYYPPVLYCFLSSKRRRAYDTMWEQVKALASNANNVHNIRTVVMDFESSCWISFRAAFPQADIQGCFFHLHQSMLRKIKSRGHYKKYLRDNNYCKFIRMLLALSAVPVGDVEAVYGELMASTYVQ
jgi:hypothetical protein